jgi:hypothetical protein
VALLIRGEIFMCTETSFPLFPCSNSELVLSQRKSQDFLAVRALAFSSS